MKMKLVVSIALGLCAGLAQAQSQADESFHWVAGVGFTGGGETLGSLVYTDGSSNTLKAGGLVHLVVGGEYRFANKVSLQANIGYHADRVNAADASVTFSRFPIEVLGYYHLDPNWRVGGGLRRATSAEVKARGALSGSLKYTSSTGLVLEGEYLVSPRVGVKLRVVSERYELEGGSEPEIDGTHAGVYLTGYF